MYCSRPLVTSSRPSRGMLPSLFRSSNTQLPGCVSLPASSRTLGCSRRISGSRTLPRSRGHSSTSISAAFISAIAPRLDHVALPNCRRSPRTVVVRPRSTCRCPRWKSRPVLALTMRSTGPRSQFQSNSSTKTTRMAATLPSPISQRRRRGIPEAWGSAARVTLFTCAWLAMCRARRANTPTRRSYHLFDHRNEVAGATGQYEQMPDCVEIALGVALVKIRAQGIEQPSRQ